MYKPLKNSLSLKADANQAIQLMDWLQKLETELKDRPVASAIFHPDPVRANLFMCHRQIMDATDTTICEVFTHKEGRLCLTK